MEYWEFVERIYKTTEEYKEERETPPTFQEKQKITYNELRKMLKKNEQKRNFRND